MSEVDKWDQRYSEAGYAYGTDPNDFLKASTHLLPKGGRVLCLAEGEGRNSVFLAKYGFQVTAVDSSTVAIEKTQKLAQQHSVQVTAIVDDLATFAFTPNHYDAIISIFCHLPAPLRKTVHQSIKSSLKEGGIFLLEGYTPEQLKHGTGGPPIAELLMNLKEIQEELSPLTTLHGIELERNIQEGKLHNGIGAVVQLIAQKPRHS